MELLQDQEKGHASFTAVSEFLLTHPVLSFGVQDVSRSRLRHTEVLPQDEESESMTAGWFHLLGSRLPLLPNLTMGWSNPCIIMGIILVL